MHIAHFRQPVDLSSTSRNPITLTPYIGRLRENRIFFTTDDLQSVRAKLLAAEKACASEPAFHFDPITASNVFNPVLQYAIYTVETARLTSGESIKIAGKELECGYDVIELAEKKGMNGWSDDVAKHLWERVIAPVNELLEQKWNLEKQGFNKGLTKK
ncbi:Uncharacterised protein [uncultured archaeon]|nr:Uncharacterised protein [uncultured archaeon]